MKTVHIIFIMFCFILFCTNCMKAKCEIDDLNDTLFIIGYASDNTTIVTFDSPIIIKPIGQVIEKYSLDLDRDGIIDFEICSAQQYSASGIDIKSSYINILNPTVKISVEEKADTGHACSIVDTIYNYTYIKTIFYNNQSTYSCPETGTDSVTEIRKDYYPQVYTSGETLDSLTAWSNEILTLSWFNDTKDLRTTNSSFSIVRGLSCNSHIKYLLFQINKSETISYGWLTISIPNSKEIWLHEYAIQQNALYTVDNRTRLSFYPNPANNQITIETGNPIPHTIEIHSLNGQLIYTTKTEESSHQIDLSSFQKGLYFITIRSREFVRTKKIIKL